MVCKRRPPIGHLLSLYPHHSVSQTRGSLNQPIRCSEPLKARQMHHGKYPHNSTPIVGKGYISVYIRTYILGGAVIIANQDRLSPALKNAGRIGEYIRPELCSLFTNLPFTSTSKAVCGPSEKPADVSIPRYTPTSTVRWDYSAYIQQVILWTSPSSTVAGRSVCCVFWFSTSCINTECNQCPCPYLTTWS